MTFKFTTWMASLAVHLALGWFFVRDYDVSAYAAGTGTDDFVVEQGVAIEGVAMFGQDIETVEAVEAEPVETSEARPEIEEVKAEEPIPESKVITSELGPEQESLPEEVEEVVEQQEEQVATLEQLAVLPEEQKIAASAEKSGGDASALKAYDGRLYSHLQKKVVRPRSGKRTGRVIVRFTLDPSGEVLSREVAKSSGFKSVDEAALASIDKASPFPPIPVELAKGPLVRTVPFRYRVQ